MTAGAHHPPEQSSDSQSLSNAPSKLSLKTGAVSTATRHAFQLTVFPFVNNVNSLIVKERKRPLRVGQHVCFKRWCR
jgi:hypothetical protein